MSKTKWLGTTHFLKKLAPNSLFGRLMMIFIIGLTTIFALGILLNQEERARILLRAGGQESALRIADTVLLFDSLTVAERERIISVINIPPQSVQLRWQPAYIEPEREQSPETASFLESLRFAIGEDRNIEIRLNRELTPPPTEENSAPEVRPRRGHMMDRMERGHMRGHGRGRNRDRQEPYTLPDSAIAYFVQVELQDGQWITFDTHIFKDDFTTPLRFIITLVLSLIGILLLLYWAVHWVTKPLRVLSKAADALGRDINSPPIPEKGSTEIKQAAATFNTMQQRLKSFIEDRTHIFSAMSHDLKTPITRLRLRTELLEDDRLRTQFEKDLKEMESMVTETLSFMRGIDTTEKSQPINIMALLESLKTDYEEMGKSISIAGSTTHSFLGAEPLLKRCLVNLIDNAIFYGKKAHIEIDDTLTLLTISIIDEGPGIPEQEMGKAFEPFYRLEQSRNRQTGGTGLGLTIARNIAQAHGGTITLQNNSDHGLKVSLNLPRALSHSN